MKIWAIIIIIISIFKLCIAGCQEKNNLSDDLFYQLKHNLEDFQSKAMFLLLLDVIIGLICGALLLI